MLLSIAICLNVASQESPSNSGVVSLQKQQQDESIEQFEAEILSLVGANESPDLTLSRMWAGARTDRSQAETYLASMERILPHLPSDELRNEAQLRMAKTAEYLQDYSRVDSIYATLAEQDPAMETAAARSAAFNHAQSFQARGEKAEAARRLRELWDHSSQYSQDEFTTFGRQLADVYYQMEDWESLLEVAPPVAGLLEDDVVSVGIAEHIARAYLELQDYENATDHYQRLYNFLVELQAVNPSSAVFSLAPYPRAIKKQLEVARMWRESERLAAANVVLVSSATSPGPDQSIDTVALVSEAPGQLDLPLGALGDPAGAIAEQQSKRPRLWLSITVGISFVVVLGGLIGRRISVTRRMP
jgi:tetratricopeptide (TPR) repeat protein